MKMEEEEEEGGGLMEYEQEEPSSSERREEEEEEEEEEERRDEAAYKRTDVPPIMSVPLNPVQSGSAADGPLKSAGCAALSFSINGRLVPPQPGGGSTMLTLCGLPRGSACGFTSVQVPVSPKPFGPSGPLPVSSSPTPWGCPAPGGGHTPIITGVVSGEAAHRVLSGNQVLFKSSPPANTSGRVSDSASPKSKPQVRKNPVLRHKLLRKGEQAPAKCLVCTAPYKLISELRGFLCMCSPAVTHGLNELKRRRRAKPVRRSREENSTSKKSRVSAEDASSKVVSPLRSPRALHPPTSPAHSLSPTQVDQIVALSSDPPPQGKLVILVEDFYYGSAPGDGPPRPPREVSRPYHCTLCPETLPNNISLMSHTHLHQSTGCPEPASSCPHCLRHFLSPSSLKRHVELAHISKSTVTCRICELAFDSEPDFLWHMRATHKPGEMPYACQVCDFRSSFYSDIWTHFQSVHANTRTLLCHFCLRVLRKTSCYQQHVAQHQCKQAFSCEKCRLHFLYLREYLDHKTSKHTTHVKPPQLSGLKPGTKVTVRTYSVVAGVAPCKVVDVPSPPPPPPPPSKRRRVESQRQLLWSVNLDRELRCIECLSSILDLNVHFPSVVTCSLCRFSTCCSASYANHMLSHHTAHRGQQSPVKQLSVFTPEPSLPEPLKCVSCALCCHRGDVMANHLMEEPHHSCIRTHTGSPPGQSVGLEEDMDTTPHTPCTSEEDDQDTLDTTTSVTSLPARTGVFVPIQTDSAHQRFSQLSVKLLGEAPTPSPQPAMTITFLGPRRWTAEQPELRPLSRSQLAVVLSSLCHGISEASLRFKMSPETIRSWTALQRQSLPHRKCLSRTETITEWILNHREKHLRLDEDVLLLMTKTAMELDGRVRITWGQDGRTKTSEGRDGQMKTSVGQTKTIDGQGGKTKTDVGQGRQTKTIEGQEGKTKTIEGQMKMGEGQKETSDKRIQTITNEGQTKTIGRQDGQTKIIGGQMQMGEGQKETSVGQDGQAKMSGGRTIANEGQTKTIGRQDGQTKIIGGQMQMGEGQKETSAGQDGQAKMSGGRTIANEGQTKTIGRQDVQMNMIQRQDGQTKTNEGQEGQAKTIEGQMMGEGQKRAIQEQDGQTMDMLIRGQDGRPKMIRWEKEQLLTCYNLTVDFMLSQELGQNNHHRTLTRNLQNHRNIFIHSLCSEIGTRRLPPQSVGCIDEFPLFMDLNLYQKQDQRALQFSKARSERPLLEVVLSALSDGTFLTPLLCFTGFLAPLPSGFPNNVLLESRPQGFSHQDRMSIWVKKVWRPHVTSRSRGPSLLIVDPYRGPLNMKFRSRMSSLLTAVHYIPTGCCFSLQPLDVCVTPVLRDFLQARWTQLVSDGGLDGLSLDHLALTLACWFSEVTSTLTSETHFLSRSFSSVLDLQQTKDRTKVVKMIADLTQAVLQPLETREPGGEAGPGPGPGPGPGGEVLKEVKAEKEEQLVDRPVGCS